MLQHLDPEHDTEMVAISSKGKILSSPPEDQMLISQQKECQGLNNQNSLQ